MNRRMAGLLPVLLMLLLTQLLNAQTGTPTSADFQRQVELVLPVEEPYTHHRRLEEGPVHTPRRDPSARPGPGETAIDDTWNILVRAGAGPVLSRAALDLQDYFRASMELRLGLRRPAALDSDSRPARVILAGTREDLPGCGTDLKGPKDYEIHVEGRRVQICGFDEMGAVFGIYNLEARLNLREGPYLPAQLQTTRHSLYRSRMVMSWLGWMEWPDTYLSLLAHDGFDAIYASIYSNPNGVEGPPHYDMIRNQDPARMRDLLERAGRFGIKVYTPLMFRYTGDPQNEASLRSHVQEIVTRFPEIRGFVLLTEGFMYQSFFGAGGERERDLYDWARHWARAVQIVVEECRRFNPEMEVLPWEYNIDFRPTQAELKRYVVSLLPEQTIPLLTWENGKEFQLDGFRGSLRDYSINVVGPAEVTQAQIEEINRRGMRVYSKADSFATTVQFANTPYLPVPYQWHQRYQAMVDYGVDGTLESWSNGYKPNFMAEFRSWYCWSDAPEPDELLEKLARRIFGRGSESLVLEAWKRFSAAVRLLPDTAPTMGTNYSIANPLFFQKPEPRTMTMTHSWWDQAKWMSYRGAKLNPYWPYTHTRVVFFPDFSNQVNKAELYARSASGIGGLEPPEKLEGISVLAIFNKYLLQAADELEQGLQSYRSAAFQAPSSKQAAAFREVNLVEQMRRMLLSCRAVLEFENLRFQLAAGPAPRDRDKENLLDQMMQILREEEVRTRDGLAAARRDSRLGYKHVEDYIYSPAVLEEKLRLLRITMDQEIPAYRKR